MPRSSTSILHTMRNSRRTLAALLVVAGIVLACRGDQSTAPTATSALTLNRSSAATPDDESDAPALGHVAKCSLRASMRGTAVVGPRGGRLQIGRNRLYIPAGALSSPVKITAQVVGDTIAALHFEPRGLHFARPAQLILDAARCNLSGGQAPVVLYLDDEGHPIERLDARYDRDDALVGAPIVHFSVYAVGV